MELQGTLSRESLEEDSKAIGKTLWTLIKDFCDYTSAHGFGRIKASKNWFLTIFWSMLFIGAVTIMTIQVYTLYKKYKSRPLTTLIEVETSTSLPFPTVTFCNFNPIRDKSLRENGKFSQLLSYGLSLELNDLKKDESNLYTKHFGAMYSRTACKESCLAYNQRQQCDCIEYRFPGSDKSTCNVLDKPTAKCLAKVQRMFKENKLNCTTSCPPPCREEIFKASSSFAIWPSEKHKVFYEELKLEKKIEQRSYILEDFVSDIGGQLGLWIGFSVLTVAEFLELILLIVHAAVNICKGNRPLAWRHSKPEQAQRI
ncbi:Degenerin mec-10 [Acropora cervicornis]|uniref:Degenerin mec-10 n=1 Tax=Acropora cervicornis TaxID=6130 RepID=A0AAD9V6A8_ACRCE|nr:Degenerin mec-10 [Acropora cervicornis]